MHTFSKLAVAGTALGASLASARAIAPRDVSLPGLPDGCMTSYKGIAFGWLPDDYTGATLAQLNADTGKKSCFFGDYSHISSSDWSDDNIVNRGINAGAGAVVVPSFMPNIAWDQVDDQVAQTIGSIVQKYSDNGQATYIRYAHEMNCYARKGCAGDAYYPGDENYDAFKQSWIRIANVCKGIENCYMYWCPNLQDTPDQINNWWPGADYVDIIGVDHYPNQNLDTGFGAYKDFYDYFVTPNNKPFLLGETATTLDIDQKNQWLAEVVSGDYTDYPLYKGAMWFEYKLSDGSDFEIVLGKDKDQVNTVVSNFQ